MAFFGVTKERIATITPIPHADTLDVATLEGMDFPFVVRRGEWKPGDVAYYFPVDSVLPVSVQETLGLVGRLAGTNKDRIKTIRLRGQVSMGVVAKPNLFYVADGEDITTILGVTKYEPPAIPCKCGDLLPLPCGLSKYDIEGADRYKEVFREMLNLPCVVMEKLEGQNVSFTLNRITGEHFVNQRNFTIRPNDRGTHELWAYAEENEIFDKLDAIARQYLYSEASVITLYGEYVGPGVQGNIYKLPKNEVLFFDVKTDSTYINYEVFKFCMNTIRMSSVPIIATGVLKDILDGKTTQEYSHGKSLVNTAVLREGVVYKPLNERTHDKIGRLILKTRDPIYLEQTGN